MADIRCPMCSKANKPDAEICEFCGARITPVTAPLETIKPGETPTPKKTSDLERTLPGWLRDVRKAAQDEDAGANDAGDENQEAFDLEIPDFLKSEPEPATPPAPAAQKPSSPLDLLAGLAASGEEEEDVPDWLSSLRAEQPEEKSAPSAAEGGSLQDLLASIDAPREQPVQKAPQEESWGFEEQKFNFNEDAEEPAFNFEAETPDWLAALKGQQDSPSPQATPQAENLDASPAQSGDLPSWLDDLAGGDSAGAFSPEPASASQPNAAAPEAETPDWLASLSAETPAPAQPTPSQADDTPDWLASLASDTPAASQPPVDDTPDWLSALSAESPALSEEPAQAAQPADDTPDWLSSLSADAPSLGDDEPVVPTAQVADDTPDWLSSLSADTPVSAPAQAEAETPDWLASLSGDAPAVQSEPAPVVPADDTPDWLASLSADVPSAQAEDASATLADDTPDWLSSLSEQAPASQLEAAPAAQAEDAPDWLASLSTDVPATAPEPVADDMPDWLSSLSADVPGVTEAPAEEKPEEVPAGDMPGWLSGVMGEAAQPEVAEDVEPKKAKAFQTGSLEEVRLEETPDWLAGLDGGAETSRDSELEEAPLPESSGVFASADAQPFAVPEAEQNLDSILSMDVPDWLAGFTPGELEPSSAQKQEALTSSSIDDDLAPANLPSWVQALRPVESVVSDASLGEEEQVIEKIGPLAGFRAVLPFSAGLVAGRKSAPVSIKLQADRTQQEQATLLDALVHAEGTPRPVTERRKTASDRLLRWLVAAVLLLSILLPSILGTQLLPISTKATSNLNNFISTIYGLDSDAPVLIVMDYQPAMAGEMEAALSPVLNDLMIRGKHMGFVSTLPTGSFMASRIMAQMQSRYGHVYQSGSQYVDLGYLPGDAAGIRAFATQPRGVAGVSGFDVNLWDLPLLSGINHLDDFSALIVVTDNPDNGRIWVEQAGAVLNDKPMLMVISAQAEPMLIPYYDSGQVSGILTGLSGGAIYESIREQPGLARTYWDSYGFGLVAAQVLIMVGSLWSLVMGIRARRQKQEQEEA